MVNKKEIKENNDYDLLEQSAKAQEMLEGIEVSIFRLESYLKDCNYPYNTTTLDLTKHLLKHVYTDFVLSGKLHYSDTLYPFCDSQVKDEKLAKNTNASFASFENFD